MILSYSHTPNLEMLSHLKITHETKNKIYLMCKKYTIAIVLGPVSIVTAKFHSVSHHSLREDWLFGWTKCRVSQCCLNGSLNSSDRKMVEAEKLVPDHCCYEYYSKKQNS